MRYSRASESGQTAAEYAGVLLVVAMIIAAVLTSGVAATIADAVEREICEISELERDCGEGSTELVLVEGQKQALLGPDGELDLGEAKRVSGDTTLGVPGSRPRANARAAGAIKKAACIAAHAVAVGVDAVIPGPNFATDIVDIVCNGIKKSIRYFEKQFKPIVNKLCGGGGKWCKKVIDGVCKVINKVDRRACNVLKELACFASDLNLFCSKAQRAVKKSEMVAGKRNLVVPFGKGRTRGLDNLGRAVGARATINAKTIKSRKENPASGQPSDGLKVKGYKRGCGLDQGHLVARQLGGPEDIESNFVPIARGFNRGKMRVAEDAIAKYVVKHDLTIDYDVTPIYKGKSRQPHRIEIKVRQVGGKRVDGKPYNRNIRLGPIPQIDTSKCP